MFKNNLKLREEKDRRIKIHNEINTKENRPQRTM